MVFPYPMDPMMVFSYPMDPMMVLPYPMDPMMVFPYPMDPMMVFPYPMDPMMVLPYPMDPMMVFPYPMDPMMVFPYPMDPMMYDGLPLPYGYIPYQWPALLSSPPALQSCSFWLVPFVCRHDELVPIVNLTRKYVAVYIHPLHTYTTPVCSCLVQTLLYW